VQGELHGYYQLKVDLPTTKFNGFKFAVEMMTESHADVLFMLVNIIHTDNLGNDYYYWWDEDRNPEWNEEFRTLVIDQRSISIDTGLAVPHDGITPTNLTINIRQFASLPSLPGELTGYSNLVVNIANADWDAANYKQILNFIYLIDGSEAFTNKSWMWGIFHEDLDNNHAYHRSAPYLLDGTPIQFFRKYGTDQLSILPKWYQTTFQMDNAQYTQQLKGTYLNQLMSPLRLFKDYEGKYYDMTSGTYSVRRGEWDVLMTEYKDVLGDGSEPKGDFNTKDWNDDWFIINTHAPEIVTHNTDDVYHDGQLVTHILPI